MMAARRGGMALLVVVLAAALLAGVASAAGIPLKGRRKPPPNSKFVTLTPKTFGHKRNYEVSCSDEGGPACYVGCPKECPNKCLVFCAYCLSFCMCDIFPGTSCGDPRFTGGDGNTFYFHGKKDENFCIVSDSDLHINAHFIGNHNPDLKRDFTWVQALGVTFGAGHRLYVGARRDAEWDEDEDHIQITFDAEPVDLDAVKNARWVSKALPGLSVTRMDTVNTIMVELAGVFSISANAVPITDRDNRIHKYGKTEGDSLVHLDLGFQFHNLTKDVDGVLGQTYRPGYVTKVDIKAKMPIMGSAPKYLSSTLFSTDCAVSRFHRSAGAAGGGAVTTFAS
ncbi:hypothetical protein SEVIR_5G472500v4 [Setaria viridis]|uniref:Late embryogenesis abundant protein LEA-2 subgroup domain-containing protein n=1 Tax=Setaria viridis TaxID=4556 RepID=A0A4U6URJ3_SETVI|nr:uncharacterized protein LOC117858184 [Setaria viridis]TKW19050.1 hypothetical protein SEVIR_5G472500v2 [Setaria viridis]